MYAWPTNLERSLRWHGMRNPSPIPPLHWWLLIAMPMMIIGINAVLWLSPKMESISLLRWLSFRASRSCVLICKRKEKFGQPKKEAGKWRKSLAILRLIWLCHHHQQSRICGRLHAPPFSLCAKANFIFHHTQRKTAARRNLDSCRSLILPGAAIDFCHQHLE